MAVKSKHYLSNGKLFTGKTHKMPNGSIHTGATHTASSRPLTHTKPKTKKNK